MGREVRMVPDYWEHPKNDQGHFIPLLSGPFWKRAKAWKESEEQWKKGFRCDFKGGWVAKDPKGHDCSFEEWDGPYPNPADYMPDFPPEDCTLYVMYEDTSEGTPISPAFDTPEELARWLADNEASAFGGMTATYEDWLGMIKKSGCSVGMYIGPDGQKSGVEMAANA